MCPNFETLDFLSSGERHMPSKSASIRKDWSFADLETLQPTQPLGGSDSISSNPNDSPSSGYSPRPRLVLAVLGP